MIERIYTHIIQHHYEQYKKMLLMAGPRQVGKTTTSLTLLKAEVEFHYLNWDVKKDQALIRSGARELAHQLGLDQIKSEKPFVVFDELHKYPQWKNFLKGFFDLYHEHINILVTGSSRLDVYKAGGDSLMGRYFLYRIHPLSVREITTNKYEEIEIQTPCEITDSTFTQLLDYGGFPEPFSQHDMRFTRKWKQLLHQQLFREDIRDLTCVREVGQLELLASTLKHQVGQLIRYSSLATKLQVSIQTTQNWVSILTANYYCYVIKPWSKNITRSLIKQPKAYLWDWSDIEEPGMRAENFVASHLLKAIHFWTDQGYGNYGLYFLRDKEQREVDFIVTKDNQPWFIIEVKQSHKSRLSPHLAYYQKLTGAKHAFQVVFDLPHVDRNCFDYTSPIILPVQTLLSQLV